MPDRVDEYGIHREAIIRNLRRFDSYPDQHPQKGKFPWYFVEMKGLYHRGIEVFIGTGKRIKKDMYGTYKFTDSRDSDTEIGYLVGRISFDDMAYVDWNGDDNTPVPHIFCRYKRFRQHPYETIRVFLKDRRFRGPGGSEKFPRARFEGHFVKIPSLILL